MIININSGLIDGRIKSHLAEHAGFKSRAHLLSRRLQRITAVDEDVSAKVGGLRRASEEFDLMGAEHHAKVGARFRAQWLKQRQLAAAVERYNLEPKIAPLESQLRRIEQDCRRDVSRSYDDSVRDEIDRGDPMLRALLAEQMRISRLPELRASTPSTRLRLYRDALPPAADAIAPLLVGLIEEIAESGEGATSPAELAAATELRRIIQDVQELRVPLELSDVRDTISDAKTLITRAERLGIRPTRPDVDREAAQAYEAEQRELAGIAAGE